MLDCLPKAASRGAVWIHSRYVKPTREEISVDQQRRLFGNYHRWRGIGGWSACARSYWPFGARWYTDLLYHKLLLRFHSGPIHGSAKGDSSTGGSRFRVSSRCKWRVRPHDQSCFTVILTTATTRINNFFVGLSFHGKHSASYNRARIAK